MSVWEVGLIDPAPRKTERRARQWFAPLRRMHPPRARPEDVQLLVVRGHWGACTGLQLAIHLVGHLGRTCGMYGSSVTPALSWINAPGVSHGVCCLLSWAPAKPASCSMRVFGAECLAEPGQSTSSGQFVSRRSAQRSRVIGSARSAPLVHSSAFNAYARGELPSR